MSKQNHPEIVSLRDAQTGREVFASSLGQFALAGSEAFQHPTHLTDAPLTILQDVETRITFPTAGLTFPFFDRQPQIGSTAYPLWDFTNSVFRSYPANRGGNYAVRFQFSARAASAATGVACEAVVRIPNSISIIREVDTLNKGTQGQRVNFELNFYVDQGTELDGLELYVQALGDDIEIYNVNMYIRSY